MSRSVPLLALLAACGPSKDQGSSDPTTDVQADADTDTDTDADADADTDADTDTGTTVEGLRRLDATCAPTDNALRFACTVTVDPPQPVQVRYWRSDGLSIERVAQSTETTGTQTVTLVFLAPQVEYSFEATATAHPAGRSATGTFVPGAPPVHVASTLQATGASTMGLVGGENPCDDDATAVIYDTTTGDLVWYQDLNPSGTLGPDAMVRFQDDRTILAETDGQIVKVDLEGNDLYRFDYNFPGKWGLHHDIFEHGGNVYLMHQDQVSATLTLDTVVVVDTTGVEQWEWRARDHLDIPPSARGDFLHTNSLYVDPAGDLLLSFFAQSTLGRFDGDPASPTFGEPRWLMAGSPPNAIGNDFTLDWSAVDGADAFGQEHDFHPRHDGRWTLLDNVHGRVLVLTIDETNHTATVDGAYATHESACGPQGTATDTAAGNPVVGCWGDWLREYDLASGDQIWEAQVQCATSPGRAGPKVARWYPLDTW